MKTYLADGVYAENRGFDILLYTQQGNEIALDHDVLDALFRFIEKSDEVKIEVKKV